MKSVFIKGIICLSVLATFPLGAAKVEALTWAEAIGIGAGAFIIHEAVKDRRPPSPRDEYERGIEDGRNSARYDNPRDSYDYDRGYEEGSQSYRDYNYYNRRR